MLKSTQKSHFHYNRICFFFQRYRDDYGRTNPYDDNNRYNNDRPYDDRNQYVNRNPYDNRNQYDQYDNNRNRYNSYNNYYDDRSRFPINNQNYPPGYRDNFNNDRDLYSNRDYERSRLELERNNRIEDANLRRILADVDKLASSECELNVGSQWAFETNVNEVTQQESVSIFMWFCFHVK